VLPEILGGVRNSGVDGLVLASDHVLDAGPMGLAETERAARSQGLRVASWGTSASHFPYVLGSERRVAGLLPWNADASGAWDTLEQEISHLRTSVDVLLVHVQHEGDFASRQAIARRIVAQDVDAVWFVGGNTPGPVEVRDGTPVVYGVPSLFGEKENLGLGLRWYLGDTGVVRLDLLALTTRNKQLTRAPVARARKLLERLQRESRRLSTDVRLGQQVAAVDVANHGLRKPPRLAVPYDEEVMRPPKGSLAPANQPPRCDGDTWLGNSELNLPIGEHLILRGATVRPLSGNEHKPVQVELLWERRVESEGTLPRGLVRWSGVGNGVAWRGRFVPCDGSWGFEWWKPGDRVRDEVWLFPDTPQAGQEVEVFLTVEMGKEVQRGPRGERKIRIGSFVLE